MFRKDAPFLCYRDPDLRLATWSLAIPPTLEDFTGNEKLLGAGYVRSCTPNNNH